MFLGGRRTSENAPGIWIQVVPQSGVSADSRAWDRLVCGRLGQGIGLPGVTWLLCAESLLLFPLFPSNNGDNGHWGQLRS